MEFTSPASETRQCDTALMVGSQSDSEAIVALLLRHGTDVNARNNVGRTALTWAAYVNDAEIVALLTNAGADVNARDDKGETALTISYRFQN